MYTLVCVRTYVYSYADNDTELAMAEGVSVDSDIFNRFVVLPENIRKDLITWFKASNAVSIFITGNTGVGKSTLVNGLVGADVAKEGETLDPETAEVTSYVKEINGVKVTVWDSPGLQDGTSNEAQYLDDMKKKCKGMDLCIYCVSLIETRITDDCGDIVAMQKLTSVLGKAMWENAIFILTFANVLEDMHSDLLLAEDAQKPEIFKSKLQEWKSVLTEALVKNVGVDEAVVSRIDMVPAGHPKEPVLLDRDHWLSPVWFTALYAMKPLAQPAMMKINYHRIVENIDEIRKEDVERFIHEQPVIFSKRGAEIGEKYGESKVGQAIGLALGKDISAECKVAVELHSLVSELAQQLGKFFSELIRLMVEAERDVEDK